MSSTWKMIWRVTHRSALFVLFVQAAQAQTLEQALVQVYQNNPTLQTERARLREADEQVSQALGGWRPTVDSQANIGKLYQNTPNNPLVQPPFSALTTRTVGVQVTQPLFRGFRTVEGVHAAEKQVDAARASVLNVEQQVFLNTGTAYLDIVRDQSTLDLNYAYRGVLRKNLNDTQERLQARDVTRTDLDQAQTRLQRTEASSVLAEISLSNARTVFAHLTGSFPEKLPPPKLELPDLPSLDEALVEAEKQNPQVLSASFNEEEARYEVQVNKGSLLPEIDLVGSVQRQWGVSDIVPGVQDTAQIQAQMTFPLYHAGTDYSKVRAAQQLVTERRMQLEEARRQTRETLANAWQSLKATRTVIAADKAEERSAEQAVFGVKSEITSGTRTTLDLLNAEQELMDARINRVQAEHDEGLAILQIRAALGQLTAAALALPVTLYDPELHYKSARNRWLGFDDTDDDHFSTDSSSPKATHATLIATPEVLETLPVPTETTPKEEPPTDLQPTGDTNTDTPHDPSVDADPAPL